MSEQNETPLAAILMGAEPTKPEPTPEPKPEPTDTAPRLDWGLIPDQLRELADSEVAAGRLTKEQAAEMLAADAETIEKPASPATVAVDGFPAAQMHEFTIPLIDDAEDYTPEVAAFDRQARTWLSTAGLPKDIGSAIAAEVAKVSAELRDADDTTRELYRRTETAKLQRLWLDESTYTRRVALAQKLVQEIETKAPGLKALLNETGAGNSAAVIAHLALHAERLYQTKYSKG